MEWTRHDAGYAAATVAAVALVGYLLVANFGLIPSPIAAQPPSPSAEGSVPNPGTGATAAAAAAAAVGTGGEGNALDLFLDDEEAAGASPEQAGGSSSTQQDTTPPESRFTTADGSVLVQGNAGGTAVRGRSTDTGGSGVGGVRVRFSLVGDTLSSTVDARLDCTDTSRQSCVWEASPPGLGTWEARARATDRAGNEEPRGPVIRVTVVTAEPESPAGDSDGDDEPGPIRSVVNTVGSTVGSVVDTAGRLLGGL